MARAIQASPLVTARRTPSPDAKLLRLLAETRRLYATEQDMPTVGQTLAALLSPAQWLGPLLQACELPAKTEHGRRAKAELLRFMMCGDDDGLPDWVCPSERLALSLCRDVLEARE
jgi:hypothetical protein